MTEMDEVNRQHMAAMGISNVPLGQSVKETPGDRCPSHNQGLQCARKVGHLGIHVRGADRWLTEEQDVNVSDYPEQKCLDPEYHEAHAYEGAASDLASAMFYCPGNHKLREGDQPLPTVNDSQDIQSMVIADIEARRQVGIARYGTALQAFNGRDVLRDLYEELIDAAMYVKQAMVERDSSA